MERIKLDKLEISDNKRYIRSGNMPFFWLADTTWLLFEECTKEEAFVYLKNRKDKGYNVILATLIHNLSSDDTDILQAKDGIRKSDYWEHTESIVKMAENLGLYMGLLPSWGSLVKNGIITSENAIDYGVFLGNKFLDYSNIVWVLGGDIRGSEGLDIYKKLGKKLKEITPNNLITFHPFGRTASSLWFHNQDWLDFNMFQSGHRRYDQLSLGKWDDNSIKEEYFGEDNWRYVNRDLAYDIKKPTVDGEPSYEQIPQGLHNSNEPYWQACDVRRYAYWSVFAGAMGHTYGNNAIMQFYKGIGEGSYGVKESYSVAMHHEGSSQMRILKEIVESVDYQNGQSAEELLVCGQKEKYERVSVFAGKDFILCYSYIGAEFTLNLSSYKEKKLFAYWVDPANGSLSYFREIQGKNEETFNPSKKYVGQNDWVLVIKNS